MVHDSHRLDLDWDEKAGRQAFARALDFVDRARAHPSGRLDGVVSPSQVETCRPDLLVDAAGEARRRGMRITIHAAQTMAEHEELMRRTGLTAVQYLDRLGVLGPDVILGHCIFADHHSWTRQRTRDDLATLAARGDERRALPGNLRPQRHGAGDAWRLSSRRRQRRNRHRQLSLQHAGGDAAGFDLLAARRQERLRSFDWPISSTRRRVLARVRWAGRISAGSASAPKPTSWSSI